MKAANGTGDAEQLTSGENSKYPGDWSPDGTVLLLSESSPNSGFDVSALSMDGERTIVPLLQTEFTEWRPKVSPDGRWVAYLSNESGESEVFVRPFPNTAGGKWQISRGGGDHAVWSRGGEELFYLGPEGMMVVPISAASTFNYGTPNFSSAHSTFEQAR